MEKGECACQPNDRTAVAGLTDFVLHLDKHLSAIIAEHGKATYAILFAIVFAETGFVLTPFLPGIASAFVVKSLSASAVPDGSCLSMHPISFCNTQLSWASGTAGDSLLFAAGAFAALGTLNVWALFGVFITAAILGDALNYAIGNYAGPELYQYSSQHGPHASLFCFSCISLHAE